MYAMGGKLVVMWPTYYIVSSPKHTPLRGFHTWATLGWAFSRPNKLHFLPSLSGGRAGRRPWPGKVDL